jgi:hypothetical protein
MNDLPWPRNPGGRSAITDSSIRIYLSDISDWIDLKRDFIAVQRVDQFVEMGLVA